MSVCAAGFRLLRALTSIAATAARAGVARSPGPARRAGELRVRSCGGRMVGTFVLLGATRSGGAFASIVEGLEDGRPGLVDQGRKSVV